MSNPKSSYETGSPHESDTQATLNRIRTTGSVSMTAELFEKLYISPAHPVKGDLRKTFANPTPVGLIGFILTLTPLSCELMGWRGAGGSGSAGIGTFYFFGGMLQIFAAVFEWILGNTFPCVIFFTFGAFFFSYGASLTPAFASYEAYAPPGSPSPTAGLAAPEFNASTGFINLWMAVLCLVLVICALRTNVCFVAIFFTLMIVFSLLAAFYWVLAEDYEGNMALALRLLKAAGAFCFVTSAFGWYAFAAMMFAILELPLNLPVGNLSTAIWKARTTRTSAV